MLTLILVSTLGVTLAVSAEIGPQGPYIVKYELKACRPGYSPNPVHTKCYKFFEPETFRNALMACSEDKAFLATPRTKMEALDLSNELTKREIIASNATDYLQYTFIGATKWADSIWHEVYTGRTLNNDIPLAQEDSNELMQSCGVLDRSAILHGYACKRQLVFFCEYDLKDQFSDYLKEIIQESGEKYYWSKRVQQ